jgi:hypothetical protein
MCVDYTDLNRHCLKDPFTLPLIDQVIDSTAGYILLSFLYCYLCRYFTATPIEGTSNVRVTGSI